MFVASVKCFVTARISIFSVLALVRWLLGLAQLIELALPPSYALPKLCSHAQAVSYPTDLSLGAWLSDLNLRLEFVQRWVRARGIPMQADAGLTQGRRLNVAAGQSPTTARQHSFVYWLGGMFKPRGMV